MASRALLLFARTARSAAAATYRVARLAERSALRLSPGPEPAASQASRLSGGCSAAAAMDAPFPRTGPSKDLPKQGGRVFVPKEEDLESDEALWDLYERWCKAFNQKRKPDEMARLFNTFKKTVLNVHRMNKNNNASQSRKVGLNPCSDGKLANRDWGDLELAKKYPNSCLLGRGDGKYLKQVFADYDVVNGQLFVCIPLEKGKGICEKKEISAEYQVVSGRLYADLPKGHELELRGLLVPTPEMIMRRYPHAYLGV